jgi:CheY-like chemotaxis protein
VEDEMESRVLLKRLLERSGYEVFTAVNGREASTLYHKENFDLVITDILMPEMDGLEVIRELQKDSPKTKVIAVSGGGHYYGGDVYLHLASQLEADGMLTKPFFPQKILEEIKRILI